MDSKTLKNLNQNILIRNWNVVFIDFKILSKREEFTKSSVWINKTIKQFLVFLSTFTVKQF